VSAIYQPHLGDQVYYSPLQQFPGDVTYTVTSDIYSDDYGAAVVDLAGVSYPVSVLHLQKVAS